MSRQFSVFQKAVLTLVVINVLPVVVAVQKSSAESAFELLANPADKKDFIVEKVMRADAIQLDNGKKYRLIGLNAPPAPKKIVKRDSYGIVIEEQSPVATLNERAYDFARKLLEGKRVRLEFDSENKDENFYTYVYVFLVDGAFVNAEILRQGYADLKITPANTKYADILRQAYRDARSQRLGIHGE